MKKLKLIIPSINKSTTIFKVIFCYLFFTFQGIEHVKALDVYGCHIVYPMSDRWYYTPYGVAGSPTDWIEDTSTTPDFYLLTATRCFEDSGIPCNVYWEASSPLAGTVRYSGFYSHLQDFNCPIDDYIPLLFLCSASFGLFIIKKGTNTFLPKTKFALMKF